MAAILGVAIAVGALMGLGACACVWLLWAQPSDAVGRNIERHFDNVGNVTNITRAPLVRASPGHRAYRVQLVSPQGLRISTLVEASEEFVRGLR
jgi:hypothetical protein